MPCPVSSRSTRKPCRSTSASTARPIAETGPPARAAAIPRSSAVGRARAQPRRLRRPPSATRHGDRGVRHEAVQLGGHVERDQVAGQQHAVAGDAVHRLVVDADARPAGEAVDQASAPIGRRRARSLRSATSSSCLVVTPGRTACAHRVQRQGDGVPRRSHRSQLLGRSRSTQPGSRSVQAADALAAGIPQRLGGDLGGHPLAEHLDLDGRADLGLRDRQVGVGDRALDREPVAAAGDAAGHLAADAHRLRAQADRPAGRPASGSTAAAPAPASRSASVASRPMKSPLSRRDGEPEAGLARRVLGRDVGAPGAVALLQAQRVDRAVAARPQAVLARPPPTARPTAPGRTRSGSRAPSPARRRR